MASNELVDEISPMFLGCQRCGYQLENLYARCRACGGTGEDGRDWGRPDLVWYGLYREEFVLDLDAAQQDAHMHACQQRRPIFRGTVVYKPPPVDWNVEFPGWIRRVQSPPRARVITYAQDSTSAALRYGNDQGLQASVPQYQRGGMDLASAYTQPSIPAQPLYVPAQLPQLRETLVPRTPTPQLPSPQPQLQPARSRVRPVETKDERVRQESSTTASGSRMAALPARPRLTVQEPQGTHEIHMSMIGPPVPPSIVDFPGLPAPPKKEQTAPPIGLLRKNCVAINPTMPRLACSAKNRYAWPQDYESYNPGRIGYTRVKIWADARCWCGQAHPRELHDNYHHFLETLIPVTTTVDLDEKTACKKCPQTESARYKHTFEQHGRMGYYDHPNNPEVPPGVLTPFLRPWPAAKVCNKQPMPGYFYNPAAFKHPGRGWDYLPDGHTGFKVAYVDLFDGSFKEKRAFDRSLRLYQAGLRAPSQLKVPGAAEASVAGPSTAGTGKVILRPRQIEMQVKADQPARPVKPSLATSEELTSSPLEKARAETAARIAQLLDGGKGKEKAKDTIRPARCICGSKPAHGLDIPCPQVQPNVLVWLNPDFEALVQRVMITADIAKVAGYQEKFAAAVKLHNDQFQGNKEVALKARSDAYKIYAPYLGFVRSEEDCKMNPKDFDEGLQEFRRMRMQMAKIASEDTLEGKLDKIQLTGSRNDLFKTHKSSLSNSIGFEPLAAKDQKLKPNWDEDSCGGGDDEESVKLYMIPRGYLDDVEFHPQKWPENNKQALAHMQSWTNCMNGSDLTYKSAAWADWYSGQADEAIDELSAFVMSSPEKKTWQQALKTFKAQLLDNALTYVTDMGRFGLLSMTDAATPDAVSDLRDRIETLDLKYEQKQVTLRRGLWEDSAKGLGKMIASAFDTQQATHWHYLQGGILPGLSLEPACIPRLAWPARFEDEWPSIKAKLSFPTLP